MSKKINSSPKSTLFEWTLLSIVLFYGAVVFCLPVPPSEEIIFPWWANRIGFGNIVFHEMIFCVWISVYGSHFVFRRLLNGGFPMRQAAICLICLAAWCGLVSLFSPLPLQDFARSLRLLLFAVMLIAVIRWVRQTREWPLLILCMGFLTGTVINLVMSFENPFIVNETMRLLGQNTPGVGMAIAIHLAAWLYFVSSNRVFQFIAITTALVCAFGCGISFSRIGWLSGIMGLTAWLYVLFIARPLHFADRIRVRHTRRIWVPVIGLAAVVAFSSSTVQENIEWVQSLVQQKEWTGGESNQSRMSYFFGVAEIVALNPLGVGYSGFYDAMRATAVYNAGEAAEESSLDANPHSGFLYYASAGGVIGGGLSLALFLLLLRNMRIGLVSSIGSPGKILFNLIALPYLLIGLTVPYIFNSIILIVPAAIAAGWGWSHRSPSSVQLRSNPPTGLSNLESS